MLSPQTIRVIVPAALLLHAIAHAIALGALLSLSLRGAPSPRLAVGSWVFPALPAKTAAATALPFWLISTLGFLGASMVFQGILPGGEAWRQVAVVSALVSILGSALFSGIWPGSQSQPRSIFNTAIALAFNLVILVTQLWLHWPSPAMYQ